MHAFAAPCGAHLSWLGRMSDDPPFFRVCRSSGAIDDGWRILCGTAQEYTMEKHIAETRQVLRRSVRREDLVRLNMDRAPFSTLLVEISPGCMLYMQPVHAESHACVSHPASRTPVIQFFIVIDATGRVLRWAGRDLRVALMLDRISEAGLRFLTTHHSDCPDVCDMHIVAASDDVVSDSSDSSDASLRTVREWLLGGVSAISSV